MTAAFQLRTNGPAHHGQSRFFASPSRAWRRAPRSRNARPAKHVAGSKTASRKIFSAAPKTRLETASQTLGTHQKNLVCGYDFASGCAVAPNSALQQAQATAAQLGWNGFKENLSESQQLYYGKTAQDILALQAQGKDMTRQWQQVISEVPGVITDSRGLMAGDSADQARSSWMSRNGIVIAGGAAVGAIITGYTRHGLNQAISRDGVGVSPSAMLDAVKYPQQTIPQPGGATQYVGRDATVVVNANGKVITTWANNGGGVRVVPGNATNRPQGP